jgi:hypothetical protein
MTACFPSFFNITLPISYIPLHTHFVIALLLELFDRKFKQANLLKQNDYLFEFAGFFPTKIPLSTMFTTSRHQTYRTKYIGKTVRRCFCDILIFDWSRVENQTAFLFNLR